MSTDLRSANLCGGASENKGAFLFFLENPSKKNYTDGIFKKRLLRKNGPFPVLGGKNFFCGGARGRAALECADCCEAFRAASVCVWMDVPGRARMDAMEVVHV